MTSVVHIDNNNNNNINDDINNNNSSVNDGGGWEDVVTNSSKKKSNKNNMNKKMDNKNNNNTSNDEYDNPPLWIYQFLNDNQIKDEINNSCCTESNEKDEVNILKLNKGVHEEQQKEQNHHDDPKQTDDQQQEHEHEHKEQQQQEQEQFMILLVGLPGSGKSTFAITLTKLRPNKYVWINQDKLGSRPSCVSATLRALQQQNTTTNTGNTSSTRSSNANTDTNTNTNTMKLCPIIDRCNFDCKQRYEFIQLAIKMSIPVDCIVFDYNRTICEERCKRRCNHPTINNTTTADNRYGISQIIRSMQRMWIPPTTSITQQQQHHLSASITTTTTSSSSKAVNNNNKKNQVPVNNNNNNNKKNQAPPEQGIRHIYKICNDEQFQQILLKFL